MLLYYAIPSLIKIYQLCVHLKRKTFLCHTDSIFLPPEILLSQRVNHLPFVQVDACPAIGHLVHQVVDHVVLIDPFRCETGADHRAVWQPSRLENPLKRDRIENERLLSESIQVWYRVVKVLLWRSREISLDRLHRV